jgi:hypothetical protein
MAVHFVGFRGDEYHNAVKVFGKPDFFHYHWDYRAAYGGEMAEGDTVVFARAKDYNRYVENRPVKEAFNDSEVF